MLFRSAMHKSFDHDKFAEDCDQHNNIKMLISYNSDQLVKDRFKNCMLVVKYSLNLFTQLTEMMR